MVGNDAALRGNEDASRLRRLPWECVETFPGWDSITVTSWEQAVELATDPPTRARALIGRALARYWVATDQDPPSHWPENDAARDRDVAEAIAATEHGVSPRLRCEVLLGSLYATWGPDSSDRRESWIDELTHRSAEIDDEELVLRILEWRVVDRLDHGDLDAAKVLVETFADAAVDTELVVFRRREILWRGCIAMLEGRIDEAVAVNQDAISRWADVSGSPFSFQNVAITVAIERYLRRGLGDVIEAVRSVRASSPRVGTNWTVGLAFTLSQAGHDDEARQLLASVATDNFVAVRRDLNWLVTMQLCGLIALTLDDESAGRTTLELLRPYAHFDGTHGSGYASYGPIARVVASLAGRWGDLDESEHWYRFVVDTRPPGPWRALARLDRAVTRSASRPAAALDDAHCAASELAELGLASWAREADRVELELLRLGHGEPLAELTDDRWRLVHPSGTATVAAGVGATYLVTLLAAPHRRLEVGELDRSSSRLAETRSTMTGRSIDRRAREAYRRRLDQLVASTEPSVSTETEIGFLRRELAGFRYVVASSTDVERARVRVTKAIVRTIDAVSNESAGLGTHLRDSISTGRACSYQPADGRSWLVRAELHRDIDG